MPDTYTHGHHPAVLRSHAWRTARNSAAYLLPHLRAGQDLLDVGCGPGTITLDLARMVAPARVLALDLAPEVVDTARAAAVDAWRDDVEFAVGDLYHLDAGPDTFDVAHAHQVLQHRPGRRPNRAAPGPASGRPAGGPGQRLRRLLLVPARPSARPLE